MIQGGSSLGFNFKALQPIRVSRHQFGQNLNRDLTVQPRIARAIHLTHAARPQGRQNFILTESCTRGQGHESANYSPRENDFTETSSRSHNGRAFILIPPEAAKNLPRRARVARPGLVGANGRAGRSGSGSTSRWLASRRRGGFSCLLLPSADGRRWKLRGWFRPCGKVSRSLRGRTRSDDIATASATAASGESPCSTLLRRECLRGKESW